MRVRLSALFSAAVVAVASFGAPTHAAAESVFKVGLIAPLSALSRLLATASTAVRDSMKRCTGRKCHHVQCHSS